MAGLVSSIVISFMDGREFAVHFQHKVVAENVRSHTVANKLEIISFYRAAIFFPSTTMMRPEGRDTRHGQDTLVSLFPRGRLSVPPLPYC